MAMVELQINLLTVLLTPLFLHQHRGNAPEKVWGSRCGSRLNVGHCHNCRRLEIRINQ